MTIRTSVNIPVAKLVTFEPNKFGTLQCRCLISSCQWTRAFVDAEYALDEFAGHLKERHGARGGVRKRRRSLVDTSV
jgi:hypothetical protein